MSSTKPENVNKDKEKSSHHLYALDYLRVFAMILVIANHDTVANEFLIQKTREYSESINIFDILRYQIRPGGVSIFMFISMLLFTKSFRSYDDLKKRVSNLLYLFGFWSSFYILFDRCKPNPTFWGVLEFVWRGGGWLYYFIPNLILCSCLGWLGQRMTTKGKYFGALAGVLVALGVYFWLLQGFKWTKVEYYWLPTSFLMMPFLALIITPFLQRIVNDVKFRLGLALLLSSIAVAFAIFEWSNTAPRDIVFDTRTWLPWHERISVQFTGVAIVVLGLGYKRKAGKVISFLSNNSLGIYCMHAFLVGFCSRAAVRYLGDYNPWLVHFIGFISTIALAAVFTEFLRRAFKHRLV